MSIPYYQEKMYTTVEEYKNAHIEIKQLITVEDEYEQTDQKIINYLESLKEVCLYLMLKKKYISLISDKDTFYDNETFNELIQYSLNFSLYDDAIKCIDVIDLLQQLNDSFGEYYEKLYKYMDEMKKYLSLFNGQIPSEPSQFIKGDFEKIFGEFNIANVQQLPINQRKDKQQEIHDKKELLLDQHVEIDDTVLDWIEKLREMYLSENLQSNYNLDSNRKSGK